MLINNTLPKFSAQQNIISAGIRMLEYCKLSFKAEKWKKEDEGIASFIQRSIKEGDTVLDIGSKDGNHLYFMRRMLRESGRIIAFESQPYLYQQLFQLKKRMNWNNVETEFIRLSDKPGTAPVYHTQNLNAPGGAIIINININGQVSKNIMGNIPVQTLDTYCDIQHISPGF